jgi:hypothetical protein
MRVSQVSKVSHLFTSYVYDPQGGHICSYVIGRESRVGKKAHLLTLNEAKPALTSQNESGSF